MCDLGFLRHFLRRNGDCQQIPVMEFFFRFKQTLFMRQVRLPLKFILIRNASADVGIEKKIVVRATILLTEFS